MEVSRDLVRSCLLYDFKVGLSAAASSLRICQAFGDGAVMGSAHTVGGPQETTSGSLRITAFSLLSA